MVLCLPDEMSKKLYKQTQICLLNLSMRAQHLEQIQIGLTDFQSSRHHKQEEIRNAECVSNPGCYPTGFLMLVKPLIEQGILKKIMF